MDLFEVHPDKNGICLPCTNRINLIYGSKGIIVLPKAIYLCQVHLLFLEIGEFEIFAEGMKIHFGNISGKLLKTQPGNPGFSTQPSFIYNPNLDRWIVRDNANLYFFDEEVEIARIDEIYKLLEKE